MQFDHTRHYALKRVNAEVIVILVFKIAGLGKSEKLPNIDKMYCLTTLNCCCFIITSGLATHISPKTVLDVII